MTDINKLREEELNELQNIEVEAEEVNLEDLLVFGDSKKIPIHIIYTNEDGSTTKARALVKQLTLKELDKLNVNTTEFGKIYRHVLRKALFKNDGEPFSKSELDMLPIGVAKAIGDKILELSGVDSRLQDF